MLEALYEIGKHQKVDDPLAEITQDFGENYRYLFKIVFRIEDSGCRYERVSVEEIDSAKKNRYLYKKGAGANAPDVTPISKITEPEKTFKTKILKSVQLFIENVEDTVSNKDLSFIRTLDLELREKKDQILSDILATFSQYTVNPKNAAVLGITFIQDGEEKYLGDLEVFSKGLLQIGYKSNYYKFKKYSRARNKVCYMCKKPAEEVWGYAGTFQFYTVDKVGMVTGGFDQELAWKNYPLCPDCYLILERGKKYVLRRLAYRFCGFNYFLIPKLVWMNEKNLARVLSRLRDYRDFTLMKDSKLSIPEVEEKVFQYLADQHNYANFDFLFYEEKQSGKVFNILLYLENITPSRLAFIIDTREAVDNDEKRKFKIFTDIPFSFHAVRTFFNNTKVEGNFDKYFLDIIKNIFFLKPISQAYLLNRFMERIRAHFLNDRNIFYPTLSAFKILLFLEALKILNKRRYTYMDSQGKYESFFQEHKDFFGDEAIKAIFLEGVLVQKLLNIQGRERGAQPFRSRLNGLKIDEKIARRLLPEAVNKLEEYEKNYYRDLEAEISRYFLNSDLKKFGSDELSFYFVLGMNLARHFEKREIEEAVNE